MPAKYTYLTPEMVEFFINHGYVVIKKALDVTSYSVSERSRITFFKETWMHRVTHDVWIRLGVDPNDKSTWKHERIRQCWHRRAPAAEVAPAAWGAICELVGGEDRILDDCKQWRDGLMINLGKDGREGVVVPPREPNNWHCNGDFLHFLDSPEQGLLVMSFYSDVKPRGGGTYIAEDSIGVISRWLRDHPKGVGPGADKFDFCARIKECRIFTELTGERGDVILIHPLMLRSASINHTQAPRFITNPAIMLKQPFNFDRENATDFSLVELKTLKELGVDRLDFRPAAPRQNFQSDWLNSEAKLRKVELLRMRAHSKQTGVPIDSEYANTDIEKV